jgi:hypothetical protein
MKHNTIMQINLLLLSIIIVSACTADTNAQFVNWYPTEKNIDTLAQALSLKRLVYTSKENDDFWVYETLFDENGVKRGSKMFYKDILKREIKYDEKGNIIFRKEYDIERHTYQYDNRGNMTLILSRFDDNTTSDTTMLALYDEGNRLIKKITRNRRGKIRLKHFYSYNKKGHPLSEIKIDYDGDTICYFKNKYFEDGVTLQEQDSANFEIRKEFDRQGNVLLEYRIGRVHLNFPPEIRIYEGDTVFLLPSGQIDRILGYGSHHFKRRVEYNECGQDELYTKGDGLKEKSTYDDNCNLLSHTVYNKKTQSGYESKETFTYDSLNRVTSYKLDEFQMQYPYDGKKYKQKIRFYQLQYNTQGELSLVIYNQKNTVFKHFTNADGYTNYYYYGISENKYAQRMNIDRRAFGRHLYYQKDTLQIYEHRSGFTIKKRVIYNLDSTYHRKEVFNKSKYSDKNSYSQNYSSDRMKKIQFASIANNLPSEELNILENTVVIRKNKSMKVIEKIEEDYDAFRQIKKRFSPDGKKLKSKTSVSLGNKKMSIGVTIYGDEGEILNYEVRASKLEDKDLSISETTYRETYQYDYGKPNLGRYNGVESAIGASSVEITSPRLIYVKKEKKNLKGNWTIFIEEKQKYNSAGQIAYATSYWYRANKIENKEVYRTFDRKGMLTSEKIIENGVTTLHKTWVYEYF